jgi:hypothetical protein
MLEMQVSYRYANLLNNDVNVCTVILKDTQPALHICMWVRLYVRGTLILALAAPGIDFLTSD